MERKDSRKKIEEMTIKAQKAICERANGLSDSFTEEQFHFVGSYLLYGDIDTPWPDSILPELVSYAKNSKDIHTSKERRDDLIKEIEEFGMGKIRYYLDGKSYGDLRKEVKKAIIECAKDSSKKDFTQQQAKVIKEWQSHPFNKFNFKTTVNVFINKILWSSEAKQLPRQRLHDIVSKFRAHLDYLAVPRSKEELIALAGNGFYRYSSHGKLLQTEVSHAGRTEDRKVEIVDIKDNDIKFGGINAPRSWDDMTPKGKQEVCQWVYDNIQQTRRLPDMFYQALDVLKDYNNTEGKQREGYMMFQRIRDDLYFGVDKYVTDYALWSSKVSADFHYFIEPNEHEISSHYKELADALAIMPRTDIEKFVKEVENHPQREELCKEMQEYYDKKDQLKALAVELFGENASFSLLSYPEVDRVCLGDMPDTITIDGIEIKDGQLKLMSDDFGGEIEQSSLHRDDIEAISTMLKEAHAAYEKVHKTGESEDKRPLIKVVYDEDLSNYRGRDYYLGDNGRYFTRQPEGALSYDDEGKVIKDNWNWVICTDNYYLEPDYAYDKYARFEIVDSLDEKQEQQKELGEAKSKLFATIHDASKDLGNKFSIDPTLITINGKNYLIKEIFENPLEDRSMIGGISHNDNEDCVHDLTMCLENTKDIDALCKAVNNAHISYFENRAKVAIHDRIVNSWQRSFTPDQVDDLKRYRSLFPDEKDTKEVFKNLHDDVCKQKDVASQWEEWKSDALKELNDLAEGITRDHLCAIMLRPY